MDLPHPYLYEGRAVLSCSVLLSFGGTSVARHATSCNIAQLYRQIDGCLDRIHALGVRHKDTRSPNVLRDARTGRVMVIDFERAEVEWLRSVLGDVCPNRKRKRQEDAFHKHRDGARMTEGGQLKDELQRLARTRCGVAS
jgi:serine/threonine protein kinase